jgi:hypothetical protein
MIKIISSSWLYFSVAQSLDIEDSDLPADGRDTVANHMYRQPALNADQDT